MEVKSKIIFQIQFREIYRVTRPLATPKNVD